MHNAQLSEKAVLIITHKSYQKSYHYAQIRAKNYT